MFHKLTILPGKDKDGQAESFSAIHLKKGQLYAVVGNTGSGKSRLIQDLEQLAWEDTGSGRKILIDGKKPDQGERLNLSGRLIAHLSQNMRFVLDVTVEEFIRIHSECRGRDFSALLPQVIDCANRIAWERIQKSDALNLLSGGQSRALMIADVAILCESPVVLIDEVENAGIDKERALQLLLQEHKLVLAATHDPHTALMSNYRICMKNGAVAAIIPRCRREEETLNKLSNYGEYIWEMQKKMRAGELCIE